MPIFEYLCKNCGKLHEELYGVRYRPDFINCQECGSPAQYKMSAGQFEVKGANYLNGYAGESNFKWIGDDSKTSKK